MTFFNTHKIDPRFGDRYETGSNWAKLLFRDDAPLQSVELIELQSLLRDNLAQAVRPFFRTGQVVSGLRVEYANGQARIGSGEIFFIDTILQVPAAVFSVGGQELVRIGVFVEEIVETEIENSELTNRTPSNPSGFPGAARQKWVASLRLNEGFEIALIDRGEVFQKAIEPLTRDRELEAFIFDRMGNFCVRGFGVTQTDISSNLASNLLRFDEVKNSLARIESDYSAARDRADDARANVESIREQLQVARQALEISQTEERRRLVASLEEQERIAEANSVLTNDRFVSLSLRQKELSEEMQKLEKLAVDSFGLQIQPGLGYVSGRRVCVDNAQILVVPKELPQLTVASTRFRVSRTINRSIRLASAAATVPAGRTTFSFENVRLRNRDIARVSFFFDTPALELKEYLLALVNGINGGDQIINWQAFTVNGRLLQLEVEEIWLMFRESVSVNFFETAVVGGSQLGFIFEASTPGVLVGLSTDTGATFDPPGLVSLSEPGANSLLQLGFRPVASVDKVIGVMEEFNRPVVRAVGDVDTIIEDSVESVLSIVQGNVLYFPGIDWELFNQSQIRWYPGRGPRTGTTYFVSFRFTRILRPAEYTLDPGDYLRFLGASVPVSVDVTYSFFLKRAGAITVDVNGNPGFILSAPAVEPVPPTVPNTLLHVADFFLDADGVRIEPAPCRQLDISILNSLVTEARDSFFELEQLKKQFELIPADWSAIDGFSNFNDVDLELTTCAFNPSSQAWTSSFVKKDIPITNEAVLSLPFSVESFIQQDRFSRWTELESSFPARIDISPRATFLNNQRNSHLSPCDPIILNQPEVGRRVRSTVHQDYFDVAQSFVNGFPLVQGSSPWAHFAEAGGNDTIEIHVTGVTPNSPFSLFVDDLEARLGYQEIGSDIPLPGRFTVQPGTLSAGPHILASSTGEVRLKYRYKPEQIGAVSFKLIPRALNGRPKFEGPALETSGFIFNNILNLCTIGAGLRWVNTRVSMAQSMAQSLGFALPQLIQTIQIDEYCSLVDIRLRVRKAPTNGRIRVNLLRWDGKNSEVLGIAELSELQQSVSGALWSTFTFNHPLILAPGTYAIGIDAEGGWQLFTSLLGEAPLGGTVNWHEGELFVNVDGVLDLRESEALCFVLRRARFESSSTIDLNPITFDGVSEFEYFALNGQSVLPPGVTADYQYLDTLGWRSFQPNHSVCNLLSTNNLEARVILHTANPFVSPLVVARGASFSVFDSQLGVSRLVSRAFEFEFVYRSVDIIVDHLLPPGCELRAWHSPVSKDRVIDWGLGVPEWTELDFVSTTVLDETANYARTIFRAEGLEDVFGLLSTRRNVLRYRLDLHRDGAALPAIRRVQIVVRQTPNV